MSDTNLTKKIQLANTGLGRRIALLEKTLSEKQRALTSLRGSEKRYRRLFESAKDGILILDADTGKVVDVNPFLLQLLGYPYGTLCGKCIWEIGLFRDLAVSKDVFKTLPDNEYIRYDDLPLQTINGQSIAVVFVSNDYKVDRNKVIQCNIRDITERKRAEERLSENHRELHETALRLEQSMNMLQVVVESIPVRVFWKDRDLRYLGCNTLFARDAGLSRSEELLGLDDFVMGWRKQAEFYRADDRKVMESGLPKLNIVEQQSTPTGAKIWLNTSKVPLLMHQR